MLYFFNCNFWLLPVAVIQYTFTQKYTEQHIVTEYTEQNVNNSNNT